MDKPEDIRLLSVVWYKVFPAQMGGQKGIAHFNRAISQYVQLTCMCAASNAGFEEEPYTVLPELPVKKKQFIQPAAWKKIFNAIRTTKATHLLIEHPYYGLMGMRAKKKFGIPFIVHAHNIEWQRFKTMKHFGWRLLKWYEGFVLRRANLVLFKSGTDRDIAIKYHRLQTAKTHIVPYGTWLEKPPDAAQKIKCRECLCRAHHIPADHTILLFNGTFNYPPNEQALEHISKHILPLLKEKAFSFTLVLCGKDLSPGYIEANQHLPIIHAGLVDDAGPYYMGADVFINPVQTGGGVKTKLVEAIAHNLTAVSTQTGATGIPQHICGEKLVTCADNDWNAFAHAIISASAEERHTPAIFYQTLHWQRIALETVSTMAAVQ